VAVALGLGAFATRDIWRRRPGVPASGAAPSPAHRAATPAARRLPAAALPAPPATATATPSFETSSVTLSWRPEPTATAVAAAPRRRQPTATPAVPQCVAIGWASRQGTLTNVLVDIEAENRCGRDLEPLEVWFEVSGSRQGDLVQSARGHLFDRLHRGGTGRATIALPGSADWMETIQVVVLDPSRM
jgi:hypothetical protein